MKRQIIFGTVLSAALAVGVAAQQPPAGSAGERQQPAGQATDPARTVTISGCLQASTSTGAGAAATPAPGAPATPSQASSGFILTNASRTGTTAEATPTPGAATGSTERNPAGVGTTGMAASTYRLMGGEDKDLQQYVGQKVEVTGTLSGRGMGSGGAAGAGRPSPDEPPAPGAPAAGATTPAGQPAGPALRVSSVRPTGERCSQ